MQDSNYTVQNFSQTNQAFSKFREEGRQHLANLLRRLPAMVDVAQKLKGLTEADNYKVVIPPDLLRRIQESSAHLGKSTSGGWSANIHDSKTGAILGQISLVDIPPELISSLSQVATQSSLAQIAERLETIENKIDAVLQGQRDDRIGLLDSAENLYIMAASATDPENRRELLRKAVGQLSEARGRMIRSLESNIASINELPSDKWEIILKSLVRNLPKEAETRSELLEAMFRDVLRASCLMALACGQLGETASLKESWRPLEKFMPKIQAAQRKALRWFPSNPTALPDKLTTLLSTTDKIILTGKSLEGEVIGPLEIEIGPD